MPLTNLEDYLGETGEHPWLESGAGMMGQKASAIPSEQVRIAALLSLAITAKRFADMFEPGIKMLTKEAARELKKNRKD